MAIRLRQVADSEMERRWKALLAEMEKADLDALLAVNSMGLFEGPAKYITDIPYTHYPYAAMLAKDGVTVVSNGTARGGTAHRPYINTRNLVYTAGQPGLPLMSYADKWLPEKLAESIKKSGYKRIGLANRQCISISIIEYLKENIDGIEFVDAGRLANNVIAVKSEYEINELYMPCIALHDKVFSFVDQVLRPGRCCHDVALDLRELCVKADVTHMFFSVDAHPTAPGVVPYYYSHDTIIHEDDVVQILIEVCSNTGIWGEVGRNISFHEPPESTYRCTMDAFRIQEKIAKAAVPGAKACDLFHVQSEELAKAGYLPELCFDIHASGCSAIEEPVGIAEDDMVLQENMFLAIHPCCITKDASGFCCDNYLITKNGGIRLNTTPSDWIRVKV